MPNVLTTSSTVSCGHPPGTFPVQSTAKLRVGNAGVLVKADIDGKNADGKCAIVPPPQSNVQCKTATVTSGTATKLTVGGNAVMLEGPLGQTNGNLGGVTPQVLLAGTANQTKLTSV